LRFDQNVHLWDNDAPATDNGQSIHMAYLLDLIDKNTLDKIMVAYTKATRMGGCIYDTKGNILAGPYNFSDFCLKFCRGTHEGLHKCTASARYGAREALRKDGPTIYSCLNSGLVDCASAITVEGQMVAVMICGQVRTEDYVIDRDLAFHHASAIGIRDMAGYMEALYRIPKISYERLHDFATLQSLIAGTLGSLATNNKRLKSVSRKRIFQLINSVSDYIIATDTRGFIENQNRALLEALGRPDGDLSGQPIESLFLDRTPLVREMAKLRETRDTPERLSLGLLLSDKKLAQVDTSLSRMENEKGELHGFVAVMRDMTEEKTIERMKSDLFGMLTHDMINPILAIKSALKLVLDGQVGHLNQEQTDILRMAADTNHDLMGMVSDFLDVFRNNYGMLVLRQSRFDIHQALQEVVNQSYYSCQDRKIRIDYQSDFSDELPYYGDRLRLLRTFANLLDNAIKFSEGEDLVTIETRRSAPSGGKRHGESVRLRPDIAHIFVAFHNRGKDLPMQDLGAMFDKFYTSNHKNPAAKKGLGLGLNFCKLVAEGHGGHIWAETTDDGLRIVLALPVPDPSKDI